jgi:protein SCO1/2
MASSRPLFETLFNLPARECRRFLSSNASSARRPAAVPRCSRQHQPLVQKRLKYKTVEEAKSRYRSGVRITPSALWFSSHVP